MVYTEYFKGCESVVLENELLRVVVLPSIGGKIASIYKKDKQFELLFQNKEELYRKANVYDPFGKFDVSGFDDAFPTIDYCTVAFKNKDVNYPDHGEIWSMGFDYKKTDNELTLCSESSILPYNYRKSVRLDGDIVICNYEIISTGDEDFPCLWAMHCLINIEKDMKFIFPDGTDEVLNVLNSRNLGEKGTVHSFPFTKLRDGNEYRLDRILPSVSALSEKYYVNGKVKEGMAGAYYPSKDVTYKVYFDKEKLPYLGLWVTQGEYGGDYNCALEPTNGFYDSVEAAQRDGDIFILKKEEKLNFSIKMELK